MEALFPDDDTAVCEVKKELEAKYHPKCIKQFDAYEKCTARVEGHEGLHCTGYYVDYYKCLDEQTTPDLWKSLY